MVAERLNLQPYIDVIDEVSFQYIFTVTIYATIVNPMSEQATAPTHTLSNVPHIILNVQCII